MVFQSVFLDFQPDFFLRKTAVFTTFTWGEEPRLAYNRVAMTSYFQHRSPEELAMSLGGVVCFGKMSGEAVV